MDCLVEAWTFDRGPVDPAVHPFMGDPVASGSSVIAVTAGCDAHAVDAATGRSRWTVPTNGYCDPAVFGLVGDVVQEASPPLVATLWWASVGSSIGVQPAVAGWAVSTGSHGGTIDAFAATGCGATTCDPLWTHDVGAAITGAPAVSAGQLYVATADDRLIAVHLP